MKKRFLSMLLTLTMCLATIIISSQVTYATSDEAYQGIFMKGDMFISIELYPDESLEFIGMVNQISEPAMGSNGYPEYDVYNEFGKIFKTDDSFYIVNDSIFGKLDFNSGSITISNTYDGYTWLQGEYTQISNYGGNMSPDMIWFNNPKHEAQTRTVKVMLNGSEVVFDQPPIIENDRTLVPIRAIAEGMNMKVTWEQKYPMGLVSIYGTDKIVKLKVNNNIARVNAEKRELDVPAKIINDRTLVPLRFVSEAFGATVDWDEENSLVTITYQKPDVNYNVADVFGKVNGYYITDEYLTKVKEKKSYLSDSRCEYVAISGPDEDVSCFESFDFLLGNNYQASSFDFKAIEGTDNPDEIKLCFASEYNDASETYIIYSLSSGQIMMDKYHEEKTAFTKIPNGYDWFDYLNSLIFSGSYTDDDGHTYIFENNRTVKIDEKEYTFWADASDDQGRICPNRIIITEEDMSYTEYDFECNEDGSISLFASNNSDIEFIVGLQSYSVEELENIHSNDKPIMILTPVK